MNDTIIKTTAALVIERLESEQRMYIGDVTDRMQLVDTAINNYMRDVHQKDLANDRALLAEVEEQLAKARNYMTEGKVDAILKIGVEFGFLTLEEMEELHS